MPPARARACGCDGPARPPRALPCGASASTPWTRGASRERRTPEPSPCSDPPSSSVPSLVVVLLRNGGRGRIRPGRSDGLDWAGVLEAGGPQRPEDERGTDQDRDEKPDALTTRLRVVRLL